MNSESYRYAVAFSVLALLGTFGAGCGQQMDGAGQPAATTAAATATTAATSASVVAKIVFVGKQEACDCTRKTVDDSFAALQSALAARQGDIPIEKLAVDTEPAKVAPYRKMRAFVALPAIYLLDGSGALVEMLQGEITTEQLSQAL